MTKYLVAFWSNTGNNRFLANRIARDLKCDIIEIKPRAAAVPLILFGSKFNVSLGNRKIDVNIGDYERVILVGPVMMGQFLSPMKNFIKKYKSEINKLDFLCCCGSGYEMKDEKFGHGHVFKKVEELFAPKKPECFAFPVTLLLPEGQKEGDAVMKVRLDDSNFRGTILEKYEEYIAARNHRDS